MAMGLGLNRFTRQGGRRARFQRLTFGDRPIDRLPTGRGDRRAHRQEVLKRLPFRFYHPIARGLERNRVRNRRPGLDRTSRSCRQGRRAPRRAGKHLPRRSSRIHRSIVRSRRAARLRLGIGPRDMGSKGTLRPTTPTSLTFHQESPLRVQKTNVACLPLWRFGCKLGRVAGRRARTIEKCKGPGAREVSNR